MAHKTALHAAWPLALNSAIFVVVVLSPLRVGSTAPAQTPDGAETRQTPASPRSTDEALWLATAPPVEAALPRPLLHVDFDAQTAGAPTAEGQGIAGSRCADLRRLGPRDLPPTISDPELLRTLDHATSLTITGWFRMKLTDAGKEHRQIVALGRSFGLFLDVRHEGRLILLLPRTASGHRATLCGSWFRHHFPAICQGCWSFFAVTYDGAKAKDNVSFYTGTERHPARRDHTYSSNAGRLGPAKPGPLVLGAASVAGRSRFPGRLDSLRIYANQRDGSAALRVEQVEAVRQSDLGRQWLSSVVADKRQAKAAREQGLAQTAARHWGRELNAAAVDLLDNGFPDRPPEPLADARPVSVPRGGRAPFQFVVMSKQAAACRVNVLPIRGERGQDLAGDAKLYYVLPVPVEANNNGGCQTSAKRQPNPLWRPYFIREAPFRVGEVLVETAAVRLDAGVYHAFVLDVAVPPGAAPGRYRGAVRFTVGERSTDVPFSLHVHKTLAPDRYALKSIRSPRPEPENLTTAAPPEWWSARHWRLLENAGRALRAFGDTAVLTPVLGRTPTVQVTVKTDGSYAFDFTRFDRWVETFARLGYQEFDGRHVVAWGRTPAFDERTGKTVQLFPRGRFGLDNGTLEFLAAFYPAFHGHLEARGWVGRYVQCQLDEPHDEARYRSLAGLLRKHMPGVRSKDAINGSPAKYSPLVDVHVFGVVTMVSAADVVAKRRADGRAIWMYHCCSPYPPYPNRHLDEALTSSRLYPWLAYLLGAEGYLFWGANVYRGADPYTCSVGPTKPGGYREVGHPPGDNWMFYKYEHGLRPSMRMLAFREGLLDHTLLTMLAKQDRERADAIMRRIARSLLDFERRPDAYHAARTRLLEELDRVQP